MLKVKLLKYLRKWTVINSYVELSEINAGFDKRVGALKIEVNLKEKYSNRKRNIKYIGHGKIFRNEWIIEFIVKKIIK